MSEERIQLSAFFTLHPPAYLVLSFVTPQPSFLEVQLPEDARRVVLEVHLAIMIDVNLSDEDVLRGSRTFLIDDIMVQSS